MLHHWFSILCYKFTNLKQQHPGLVLEVWVNSILSAEELTRQKSTWQPDLALIWKPQREISFHTCSGCCPDSGPWGCRTEVHFLAEAHSQLLEAVQFPVMWSLCGPMLLVSIISSALARENSAFNGFIPSNYTH